eukprot:TRINITY_DN6197_c0_g2_i1.p1 TRINITY_DN6197_c0_g2~~TRINITY_DN6197_c0_g2_i1.p1  ORF type:complete len:544 (-),score=195.32 TRINITY_DN6197_c0_g2_i1:85-1716(-)
MAAPEEALPAGWTSSVDPETGNTFYFNEALGTTQWERPPAEAAVDPEMLAAIQASKEAAAAHQDDDEAVIAALAASAASAELDWISDCLFAVFSAPTWVAPISTFIDEHCGVFEDMEENKLEYTPIHNAFKQLVDDLLTAHLVELSVTAEQFENFCQVGLRGEKALHRSIVEQLLSVDDFLIFKAMMVKRSAALHHETLMQEPAVVVATAEGGEAKGTSEEIDAAEAERLEAQRRCVEAELQLAIALSLQLEQRLRLVEALEERLRLMEKLTEMMELSAEMAAQQDEEAAAAAPAEEAAPAAAVAAAAAEQAAAPAEEIIPPATRLQPLAPLRVGPRAHGGLAPVSDPLAAAAPLPATPASPPATVPLSDAEKLALEKRRTEAAPQRANRTPGAAAAQPAPTPAAAAPAPAPEPPMPSAPAPAAAPRVTEEERKARAEHLKRQREILLEKKRQEREEQLATCDRPAKAAVVRAAGQAAAERAAGGSGGAAQDAGRRLAMELSGQTAVTEDSAKKLAESEAAAAEMRRTITLQLKQSLMGSLQS